MRVAFASVREGEVAVASGFRVVPTAGGCQVQILEPAPGGGIRVARVWPGDSAHLALWNALMTSEGSWGVAPSLQEKGEDVG